MPYYGKDGRYYERKPVDYYDATDVGADKALMSDEDYAALQVYKQKWADSSAAGDQAGMDEARAGAEGLREKYGYSGGANGGAYNPLANGSYGGSGGGSFSYRAAPAYVSRYQDQIDALTQGILGREAFSYDPEQDPTYQQYKEGYTRAGKRAMQDTLGQVSARTGGLASSYAGAAAQQTYDGYMSALADKIPELRQLAYQMYQDEGATQRSNLEMLMALEQGDYGKYQDRLSQYNTDKGFDYGVWSDDRKYNYQLSQDAKEDQRYFKEYNDSREDVQWEKDREKAETLAAAGDFSGYRALGYSEEEIAALEQGYKKSRSGASGGGGQTGSRFYSAVRSMALRYEDLQEAKKYLERMVDNKYISAEEAARIFQIDLGGVIQPIQNVTPSYGGGTTWRSLQM